MKRVAGLVALLAISGCTAPSPRFTSQSVDGMPTIRALIVQTGEGVVLRSTGPFSVRSSTGVTVTNSDEASTITVSRNENTLQVNIDSRGSASAIEDEVVLAASKGSEFDIAGTTYPDRVVIKAYGHSDLLVISLVSLGNYLEGVVPHEIGNPGPDAYSAMQAQAITARTYAMTRIAARREEPFDVFAGVRDQVYRGSTGRSNLATSAVRDTRGLILENGGDLAAAYYCATCGGHTSDIRRVWPQREGHAYLYGVLDRGSDGGSYCSWVHNFRWRFSWSGRELGEMLRRTIPRELGAPEDRVGFLTGLRVTERSPSGRARVLEIETTRDAFRVQGDRIRWVLMANEDRILPSTLFEIEAVTRGERVTFISVAGGGNGHGVGMCQNGAIGMARKGHSYKMILSHYYPGTEVAKRY